MEQVAIVRGIVPAVYGAVFRALRALGPLTLGTLALLIVQQAIVGMRIGPVHLAEGSAQGLLSEAVFIVLLVPVQVAVYDFALRGRRGVADHARANGANTLRYAAYALLAFLLWIPAWLIELGRNHPGAVAAAFLAWMAFVWWVVVRLFVVGPVLALRGVPIGLGQAIRATRGRFWPITLAAVLVLAILGSAYVPLAHYSDTIADLGPTYEAASVVALGLCNLLYLYLWPILEVEVYRRLGLPVRDGVPDAA